MNKNIISYPNWVKKLLGQPGIILALIWGIAEGSFFFIVPDMIISLAALFDAKKSFAHLCAVIVGAIVAGTMLFAWATADSKKAIDTILKVPFVSTQMYEKVNVDYKKHGVWALCLGPTSGIPYKLYSVIAPEYVSYPAFILVSIPARLERLIITWAMFSGLGLILNRWGKYKFSIGIGLYIIYWATIYHLYLGKI